MKFTSTPVVFSLLTALALFATSCSRSTKFSAVLDGGFDPVATFRQHGYTVQKRRAERGSAMRCMGMAGSHGVAFLAAHHDCQPYPCTSLLIPSPRASF